MSPRPWTSCLPVLVIRLVGELLWTVVEAVLFLARRTIVKEELAVVLLGKKAARELARRGGCALLVIAICVLGGCGATDSTERRGQAAERLTFRHAQETMVEILWPVYGAESPWMVLDETVFDLNSSVVDDFSETILELMSP